MFQIAYYYNQWNLHKSKKRDKVKFVGTMSKKMFSSRSGITTGLITNIFDIFPNDVNFLLPFLTVFCPEVWNLKMYNFLGKGTIKNPSSFYY